MPIEPSQPIGIFDSGIGGLTVADAIRRLLPGEQIIYFGDTAHLPYGDKSAAAIQAYSVKIADVLLQKNCKAIVIACNSASSAAYELLKEYTGSKAWVMNVIDPMVEYVGEHFPGSKVGLIGTKQTIASGIYGEQIEKLGNGITLESLATPLLVPMIEEGFFNNSISKEILDEYLHHKEFKGISALILGCTHYPLIHDQIDDYFEHHVSVLDSSEVVAQALKKLLTEQNLLNDNHKGDNHFMVSDYTDSFEASTKLFFRETVHLEKYELWE